jgi:hypothetical protein
VLAFRKLAELKRTVGRLEKELARRKDGGSNKA